MGNALRCCIACMLPCGALDVVRIVHVNGQVEELSKKVKAEEVMKANPEHVLRKSSCQGIVHRIVVLPPDAELERGHIYFLIPTSFLKENEKNANGDGNGTANVNGRASSSKRRRSRREQCHSAHLQKQKESSSSSPVTEVVISEQYLADVLSEKAHHNHHHHYHDSGRSGRHSRRNSRVGVWRPHLESISEVEVDSCSSSSI